MRWSSSLKATRARSRRWRAGSPTDRGWLASSASNERISTVRRGTKISRSRTPGPSDLAAALLLGSLALREVALPATLALPGGFLRREHREIGEGDDRGGE